MWSLGLLKENYFLLRHRKEQGDEKGKGCVAGERLSLQDRTVLHGLEMRAERGLQVAAALDVTFYSPGPGCWASDTHPEYACAWTYVPHLYESMCSDGIESETNL